MGRILVPIDPSRMGYQRQTADYKSDYQSPFSGILPHVLVNTAIPLAGQIAGAGIQSGVNAYGRSQLEAKRQEYDAGQADKASAERAGERMRVEGMERWGLTPSGGSTAAGSPRSAAASAFGAPRPRATDSVMPAVNLPSGWFGAEPEAPPAGGYFTLPQQELPLGQRTGIPITEAMVDDEGNPLEIAGGGGNLRKVAAALARAKQSAADKAKSAANPREQSARSRAAARQAGMDRGKEIMDQATADASAPPSTRPPPAPPVAKRVPPPDAGVPIGVSDDAAAAINAGMARAGQLAPPQAGSTLPSGGAAIDVSGVAPRTDLPTGANVPPPPAPPGGWVGPGVQPRLPTRPGGGPVDVRTPEAIRRAEVAKRWNDVAAPILMGQAMSPAAKLAQLDQIAKTGANAFDRAAASLSADALRKYGNAQKAATAVAAGLGVAGGVAAANAAIGAAGQSAPATTSGSSAAGGRAVGLPAGSPTLAAPPPATPAPPPPDKAGSASAVVPGAAAATAAAAIRRYGAPGVRQVDETAAVDALGENPLGAPAVAIPPPAPVADATVEDDAADAAALAAFQPPKPRTMLQPGIRSYQEIMNAAAIASTPEEKQQVLAAAELSGLVDAPSESWLDVINPTARTSSGFSKLRAVLGDAGGRQDPLLSLRASEILSRNEDRRQRAADRSRTDALIAAQTQTAQAAAAQAANQQAAKTEAMTLDNVKKRVTAKFAEALGDINMATQRAELLIKAQDARDRGEMNQARMFAMQAMAGMNNAKATEIMNMLPHRIRESQARAGFYDRSPAAGANVTFAERRAAGTEDELVKEHRRERQKSIGLGKAYQLAAAGKQKEAMDYIMASATTYGSLASEIGKANLTADALKQRLQREAESAKVRMADLETEIRERGGVVSPNGVVTFPAPSR